MKRLRFLAISIIVTTLASLLYYFFILTPSSRILKESLQEEYISKSELNFYIIENFVSRCMEGCKSISSRSMMKEKLFACQQNEISITELQDYTQTKFEDGVRALEYVYAGVRISRDTIVAHYGDTARLNLHEIRHKYLPTDSIKLNYLLKDSLHLIQVINPIVYKEQCVGYDVIAFAMNNNIKKMSKQNLHMQIYRQHNGKYISATGDSLEQAPKNNTIKAKNKHQYYYHKIAHLDAYLAAQLPEKKLFAKIRKLYYINLPLFIIFIIITIYFVYSLHNQKVVGLLQNKELELFKKNNEILRKNHELEITNSNLLLSNNKLENANNKLTELSHTIRESELKYRTLAENIPNGAVVMFDTKMRYIIIAGIEIQATGLDASKMLGKTLEECLPANAVETLKPIYKKTLAGEALKIEYATNNKIYQLHTQPILTEDDTVTAGVLIIQNITAQKKAEQDIRQALKTERELNVLKSGFVSIASHQFRTPLTTIQSSIELLQLYTEDVKGELRDKLFKHFLQILGEINRLNELLDDILLLGRLDVDKTPYKPEATNLIQFCQFVLQQEFQYKSDERQVVFSYKGKPKEINIDHKLMTHVLTNLLDNAYKYSSEAPELHIDFFDDKAVICITDTGRGIPEGEVEKVFQSFFRGNNTNDVKGTGLGLPIVKQFVEIHNGTVRCESQENIGTKFFIELPYIS